jgi:hypothetical protein
MIVGVPAVPVPVTDPDDPRLANFRDLTAGGRRESDRFPMTRSAGRLTGWTPRR